MVFSKFIANIIDLKRITIKCNKNNCENDINTHIESITICNDVSVSREQCDTLLLNLLFSTKYL